MRIELLIETSGLRVGAIDASERKLLALLEALTVCNTLWLQENPGAPSIYNAGIRYQRERGEEWKDIPHIIRDGHGDCEDLACARAAEIRFHQGIDARAVMKHRYYPEQSMTMFHVVVQLPGGQIIDPSKRLGMKGDM